MEKVIVTKPTNEAKMQEFAQTFRKPLIRKCLNEMAEHIERYVPKLPVEEILNSYRIKRGFHRSEQKTSNLRKIIRREGYFITFTYTPGRTTERFVYVVGDKIRTLGGCELTNYDSFIKSIFSEAFHDKTAIPIYI